MRYTNTVCVNNKKIHKEAIREGIRLSVGLSKHISYSKIKTRFIFELILN